MPAHSKIRPPPTSTAATGHATPSSSAGVKPSSSTGSSSQTVTGSKGPDDETLDTEKGIKAWLEATYASLPQDVLKRAAATYLCTTHAYNRSFAPTKGANWQFAPDSSSLCSVGAMKHNFLLNDGPSGVTYLQMAWAAFLNHDQPITRAIEGLAVGDILGVQAIRDAVQGSASQLSGGVYALVFIDGGLFIGEAAVFEPCFTAHDSVSADGNPKLLDAKTRAGNEPYLKGILLTSTAPATMRHVFETFVRVHAHATANLNTNVFNINFFKFSNKFSGEEIYAFLMAVKDHLASGQFLPGCGAKGKKRWLELFGHLFTRSVSARYLYAVAAGHARKMEVEIFKKKHGLEIGMNDWEGRPPQNPTVKPVPVKRKREENALQAKALEDKYGGKEGLMARMAEYGIGPKTKKKVRN